MPAKKTAKKAAAKKAAKKLPAKKAVKKAPAREVTAETANAAATQSPSANGPRLQAAGGGWVYTPSPEGPAVRQAAAERRSVRAEDRSGDVEKLMLEDGFDLIEEGQVRAEPGRRGTGSTVVSQLQLLADLPDGDPVLLIVRQESGA